MAAFVRETMAKEDTSTLVPQESSRSKTGYTNIIEVGGKFQARWQLTGDGRGGKRKRKQCPLPGIFDTALEAATYLALVKKLGVEAFLDDNGDWVTREQKARVDKAAVQQPAVAVVPPQAQQAATPAFAVATIIPCGVLPLPIVPVSPLSMPPLGYTPPYSMERM